jgi:hypothetical protein
MTLHRHESPADRMEFMREEGKLMRELEERCERLYRLHPREFPHTIGTVVVDRENGYLVTNNGGIVFHSNYAYYPDMDQVRDIVLPILRKHMVLDDLSSL